MLVGVRAKNHPQQVRRRGVSLEADERATDPKVFQALSERFGGFTLDVAATQENKKCPSYFDRETNGLEQSWRGNRVWCNPPFSGIAPWVTKAHVEASGCTLIVMLLPANRTEQKWWQDEVEPYRDRDPSFSVKFLPGRPQFIGIGDAVQWHPPFGCCLLIWRWNR